MKRILFLVSLLLASLGTWAGNPPLDIYLCIGQSNMAGRGYITDNYKAELKDVYLLNADGEMEPASVPLNKYSTIRKDLKIQGVGPAYSFAQAMAERTGRQIGLVVNARGGTGINSWLKGAEANYYGEALARARQALKHGTLKAILWHQGENDSRHPETYMAKLQKLAADLRKDLGDENLPFVVGELAEWRLDGTSQPFNRMLRTVSQHIPNSACVSSAELVPLRGENDPHFSADSQVILGKRYADAVCDLCFPDMAETIRHGLEVATAQSLFLAKELEKQEGRLPRTYEDNQIKSSGYKAWTSGFFPGVLWYLYENTPTNELKKYAELYTRRVEPAKEITSNHDVGFMIYCSFGNGFRLTNDPAYMEVMKTAASSLSTRYDNRVKAIKSWNSSKKWQYPVIIDNMMNLELLEFVGKQTSNRQLLDIADNHAQTTLQNHFRTDNSCYHVVSYDTLTGFPHVKQTHQGYADESAWARGQAWALYGYTMMYRETGKKEYLEQARKVGFFIKNHPNLPEDKVPYWDFNVPDIPNAPRDASAAAIMASAFIELSQLDQSKEAAGWLALGKQQVRSLTSPAYLAEPGTNGGYVLLHSVGNHNKHSEVDVPLCYADYYYVEALLKLKKSMSGTVTGTTTGEKDRSYWVKTLTQIADPVLTHLSQGTLKKNMPFESLSTSPNSRKVSHLEAVGRVICGIAPWLELGPDDTPEGKLRAKYIRLAVEGLSHAVNPKSPDYLLFGAPHSQSLVDAAFLAEGLLRAPVQLWGNLDKTTRSRLIKELKKTREIKPHDNNWMLFTSIIEAALLEFTGEYDETRLYNGVDSFLDKRYKGDGWYGDGDELHLDYYNSLVIQPLLTDILFVLQKHGQKRADFLDRQIKRHQRFAVELERFISPEATYPIVGRSIVYRFGVFHALSQIALLDKLPQSLSGAQVRSALTAVIKRQMSYPDTFDEDGWLKIGVAGSQINMSERYINTGSLYLCTAAFLALGLPANHSFWKLPYMEWSNLKAWKGIDIGADKALRNG